MLLKNQIAKDSESIVARCTPKGSGAIALLRISGDNAFGVVSQFSKLSSSKIFSDLKTHTIHHGFIYDSHEQIDEVLFFVMRAPKTFTGQDVIEISCHNNQFIIEKTIELAINAGARLAGPGEFTQRAFLNNKIDLVQAESINEIINAQTQLALRKSMSQLKGSLSSFVLNIEEEIFSILSLVESSFEFFEEEQDDFDINNLIRTKIDQVLEKLKSLKVNFNQQQQIKNGIKICLIGSVNTGKSTLFNALLKQDRAIVTDIAGTTRDIIESSLYKNGNFWQLTDTAGLRLTNDFIEKQGIERSMQQAALADIILLIFDSSTELLKEQFDVYQQIFENYTKKIILILNKVDIKKQVLLDKLYENFDQKFLAISAKNNLGLDKLENLIENKVQELFSELNSPFLLNQRQYALMLELIDGFNFIKNNLLKNFEYELVSHHMKQMLESISDLTGRNINEKMLDKVFSEFCVGK
ncbi:MAG: tRNA uridine-5-carboxymethylaminomethyl(34) synthesis GTPase MnmE [bacterium]